MKKAIKIFSKKKTKSDEPTSPLYQEPPCLLVPDPGSGSKSTSNQYLESVHSVTSHQSITSDSSTNDEQRTKQDAAMTSSSLNGRHSTPKWLEPPPGFMTRTNVKHSPTNEKNKPGDTNEQTHEMATSSIQDKPRPLAPQIVLPDPPRGSGILHPESNQPVPERENTTIRSQETVSSPKPLTRHGKPTEETASPPRSPLPTLPSTRPNSSKPVVLPAEPAMQTPKKTVSPPESATPPVEPKSPSPRASALPTQPVEKKDRSPHRLETQDNLDDQEKMRQHKPKVMLSVLPKEVWSQYPGWKNSDYERLLNECLQKIEKAPTTSGTSYLWGAEFLLQQCKVKGAQRIVQQGLNSLLASDMMRTTLSQLKTNIDARLNVRMDPLKTLGYNSILSSIFSCLPLTQQVRLTGVSKAWRRYLLHWPGLWHTIHISPEIPHFPKLLAWYQQHLRADHVQVVKLTGDECVVKQMVDLLLQTSCEQLTTLAVTVINLEGTVCTAVADLIKNNDQSLSTVELVNTAMPFSQATGANSALAQCHSLQGYHYATNVEIPSVKVDLPRILDNTLYQCCRLEFLVLDLTHGPALELSHFQDLLNSMPWLRAFSLHTNVDVAGLLEVIQDRCTNIEYVDVNRNKIYSLQELKRQKALNGNSLNLSDMIHHNKDMDKNLLSYLEQHGQTLDTMDIYVDLSPVADTWKALKQLRLDKLQTFILSSTVTAQASFLGTGIRYLTSLEKLHISNIDFEQGGVFGSLAFLKRLKKLSLINCSATGIQQEALLAIYFSTARLEEVELSECNFVTDQTLLSLGQNRTLLSLTMRSLQKITDNGVQIFVSKAPSCFRNLEITTCPQVKEVYKVTPLN